MGLNTGLVGPILDHQLDVTGLTTNLSDALSDGLGNLYVSASASNAPITKYSLATGQSSQTINTFTNGNTHFCFVGTACAVAVNDNNVGLYRIELATG